MFQQESFKALLRERGLAVPYYGERKATYSNRIQKNFLDGLKGRWKKMKVTIIIEKDEYGYYAFCPELPGCHSQGDSTEEALENVKEAVDLYLETLSQRKDPSSRQ